NFSIFAVGDSLASVIANRLNEADSPQVRTALVALGLLLFVLTSVINIVARLLIRRMGRVRKTPPRAAQAVEAAEAPLEESALETLAVPQVAKPRTRWNSFVNVTMTGILGLCLLAAVVPLFLILGYILWKGSSAISLAFFTETPKPLFTGSPGGLKHALLGTAILVGLTLIMAVPLGVLTAIFLAESRA